VLVDESKGVYVKVEMSRRVHWKAFRCFPSLREPIAFDDTEKYDGHIMLDPTRLSICGKVKRRGLRTEAPIYRATKCISIFQAARNYFSSS